MKHWHFVAIGFGAYYLAVLVRSALNGWILTPFLKVSI